MWCRHASVPRPEPSGSKARDHREKGGTSHCRSLQSRETLGFGTGDGQDRGTEYPTLSSAHIFCMQAKTRRLNCCSCILQPLNSCCAQTPESQPTPEQTGKHVSGTWASHLSLVRPAVLLLTASRRLHAHAYASRLLYHTTSGFELLQLQPEKAKACLCSCRRRVSRCYNSKYPHTPIGEGTGGAARPSYTQRALVCAMRR